jgi:hypothetical protein
MVLHYAKLKRKAVYDEAREEIHNAIFCVN